MPPCRQPGLLDGRAHGSVLAASRQVNDLHTVGQGPRGLCHRLVHVLGTQGASRHEERGSLGIDPEALRGLTASTRGAIALLPTRGQLRDSGAQGQTRDDRASTSSGERR